jgi:UDP-N-acetylmuramoylalanine--D-glutamate ligase
LEPIAEIERRWFYDDSIATTPESTSAALQSIEQPIWLIAGGHDKGLDLASVAQRIAARVEGVALLGQTTPRLRALLQARQTPEGRPHVQACAGMEQAVRWCFERSRPGDVILLSPACASFGMFQNFVDRARAFRQAVIRLAPEARQAG